ncbi:BA75_02790T0 [Komagataella pastoris]|uniref:Terpene cyclase/mutase family member n=1 Tax=Komagataella pastoris TaxID=4922 RepID=A0A1B2JA79_PICPA|nr:BA75_02790T0 [Komagataella pastoris]
MSVYYSEKIGLPKTDPQRWRLRVNELGRQYWDYIEEEDLENDPQTPYVQYLLKGDEFECPVPEKPHTAFESARNCADFLALIQDESGVFPCQYKGPMFMNIGYVVACYFTNTPIPDHVKTEMIRYIVNTAHPVDGGWGLHEWDKSTCFGTCMNYVVLRLLGLSKDNPVCTKARKVLHALGGALATPYWGKAWLSLLNVYKWEGVNPAPPEMWNLPYSLKIHPCRWWVHTRAIALPLSYVSSYKSQMPLTPLLKELRNEIFVQDFDTIDFSKHRNNVCGIDLYYPHTSLLDFANNFLVGYDKIRPTWLLKESNDAAYELIKKELANTEHLCIAPVNAAFNTIVAYLEEGPKSYNFKRLQDRFKDVIFHGPQGMTTMGTNGTQVWDTSFCLQYFFMAGLADLDEYEELIVRCFKFLIRSQFTTDTVDGSYRDKRLGCFPFSTKEQGYTVSDCTAEAIKAILMVRNHSKFAYLGDYIDEDLLKKGIDVLLSLQNVGSYHFGSFSTYESIRANPALEKINPAEVFGNIMVEYPYVECTDSSVLGLTYFREHWDYRRDDIDIAIERGVKFICEAQQEDGSWYGCWGVCFTYAGMFALEALASVGQYYETNEIVRKGCDFLVSKQMADGGWSESIKSCETHTYVRGKKSMVVQTSWVLIGLILAKYPDKEVIDRGVQLIMNRQKARGDFDFEAVEGIFNHSCGIEYPNYKFLFPIKALGLYSKEYEQ